jgi:hypothetical protein
VLGRVIEREPDAHRVALDQSTGLDLDVRFDRDRGDAPQADSGCGG